jgi:transcriptional regulator with XRE-family HTH domain
METPSRYVASHLREWRKKRGLTGSELAGKVSQAGVGVHWTNITVGKIETERRISITVDELLALSIALKMPLIGLLPPYVDHDAIELTERFRDYRTADLAASILGVLKAWEPHHPT